MNRDAIIRKAKGAFGKVQGLMPGCRMFLLKRGVERSTFVVVEELTIPFWSRWSAFREATLFMWADESAEWMDRVAQTSHVGYGVPDDDSKVDVFSIANDQRDRVEPNGSSLMWKLYGERVANERFTIPTPEPEWTLVRSLDGATVSLLSGDPNVGVAGGDFTDADEGRRIVIVNSFSSEEIYDGLILTVTDAENIILAGNVTGGAFFANLSIYEPS